MEVGKGGGGWDICNRVNNKNKVKKMDNHPGQHGSVGYELPRRAKTHWFDSWPVHIPGL